MENFVVPDLSPLFGGFPYTLPEELISGIPEGTMIFSTPFWGGEGNVPFISIDYDYGDIVHGAFLSCICTSSFGNTDKDKSKDVRSPYHASLIQAFSQSVTFDEVLATFTTKYKKPARYVPYNLSDFLTWGVRPLETLWGTFAMCQATGGRYYGKEVDNNVSVALRLKRAAVRAKGKCLTSEKAQEQLMDWSTFWGIYFGDGQ